MDDRVAQRSTWFELQYAWMAWTSLRRLIAGQREGEEALKEIIEVVTTHMKAVVGHRLTWSAKLFCSTNFLVD